MALVVFTGGARSGKSSAAADLARRRALAGARVRFVVFGRPRDEEMAARIDRHRADRPDTFETLEPPDADSWLDDDDSATIVVDCLGTLLGLVMEEETAGGAEASSGTEALQSEYIGAVESRFLEIVARLSERSGDSIVVTNEVGSGVVPAFASGRLFRDLLGHANRLLVQRADAAYLVVAGRLVDLTEARTDALWPED